MCFFVARVFKDQIAELYAKYIGDNVTFGFQQEIKIIRTVITCFEVTMSFRQDYVGFLD